VGSYLGRVERQRRQADWSFGAAELASGAPAKVGQVPAARESERDGESKHAHGEGEEKESTRRGLSDAQTARVWSGRARGATAN
jgi:hypothetical protein